MFEINPFAELAVTVPAGIMQGFVTVMIALVAGGTIFDIIHKGSAKYFFQRWSREKGLKQRDPGFDEKIASVAKTTAHDVLTSGEFCNFKRRLAHLLTMYGFIAYAVATAVMVFSYPTNDIATPAYWPQIWWLGSAMVCAGGYWFWFFIRVDVAAEGNSPFRVMRADLFVVSLILSATFALIWAYSQAVGAPYSFAALALYLIATTVLFGSVPWSKFSHMFFKPAAAYQKNLAHLNGGRNHLPAPVDKPATLGKPERHGHNY